MKLRKNILWDIRFQMKYGFYFLYAVLTLLYLLLLYALPEMWRQKAAAMLILSDPAAMGLFFMGAMVLLEKSQRVPWALAVSPVSASQYIAAKAVSLGLISLLVAAALALSAESPSLPWVLTGTLLCSVLFTLLGIIIAAKIASLNQFILWTMPVEALAFVPAILHLFRLSPAMLRYYPVNFCMDLIAGKAPDPAAAVITLFAIGGLFLAARQGVLNMWNNMGGAK